MKIAIQKGSGFDQRWIAYCEKNNISYKMVDCYASDIIDQMMDCDVLMWHHHHASPRDVKFAKALLFSLEQAGKKVFPNFNTAWHFDDKVGQKYLLEAIQAPLVPSYVFYDKHSALKWLEETQLPKVFKLRGGAGSSNVKLVQSKKQAVTLINRCFGKGFPQYDKWENLKERFSKFKQGKSSFTNLIKGILRLIHTTPFARMVGNEKGYAYFQEFVPNNDFDIRIVAIDNKAFALKRLVRKGDFRASGSGHIVYDHTQIDIRCVEIALVTNRKLNAQCLAYDFVFDEKNNPLIVEISYGFAAEAYDSCEGYWDSELNWHEGKFNPYGWMIAVL